MSAGTGGGCKVRSVLKPVSVVLEGSDLDARLNSSLIYLDSQ
jgi:hypothetical protein